MSGVEVLAIEEVAVEFTFNWTAFVIVLSLVFSIFVLTGFFISKSTDDWKQLLIGVIVGTVLGALLGLAAGKAFENPIK